MARPLPASRSSDLRPNLHNVDVRLFERLRRGLTCRDPTSTAVVLTMAPDRSPHARNGTRSLLAAVCSSSLQRSAALCNSCLNWEGWKPSGGVKCSHTTKASAWWQQAVVSVSVHELLGITLVSKQPHRRWNSCCFWAWQLWSVERTPSTARGRACQLRQT